ncbi:MAG TPA: hypothetical protein VF297_12270 [Pyrinomonadaceae bacterium]
MNMTWVLLAFVSGIVAVKGFELCKIIIQRFSYFRLEIGLGDAKDFDPRKQVVRGAKRGDTSQPALRESAPLAALKQDGDSCKDDEG